MNLILSPDLTYPNNTLSHFYTILPEEIFFEQPKYQAALTEFHYPADYSINFGKISLEIPSYVEIDACCLNLEKSSIAQVIQKIINTQEEFEQEALEFFIEEADNLSLKLDQVVQNLESSFFTYFQFFKTCSASDNELDVNNVSMKFLSFFNKYSTFHSDYKYSNEKDRNFFQKILNSLKEITLKLEEIIEKIYKKVTFEIIINDRVGRTELMQYFKEKLVNLSTFKNKSVLELKNNIKISEYDLKLNTLASFVDNEIKFNKTYPISSIDSFYIYTDIISDSIRNSKQEPILRVISPKGRFGENINFVFDRPFFQSINKTRLCKILIKITDQNQNPINFNSGPITLKIEIKKTR